MSATGNLKPVVDQTRRGQIYRNLRDMIIGGKIAPGTRLTETDLAERLGVSRAPLREAIRELVDTGLVISQPYKGIYIRSVTHKDLTELYSLRTTLEQFAFRQAWDKRTQQSCKDLIQRNQRLVEALESNNSQTAVELELELHSWCYELSGHSLLQAQWERIKQNLQFYFMLHQKAHKRKGPLRESHDVYVECACGDDLNAILQHLENHMQQGLETTLNFIE